jgi:hypothetical protein
MLSRTSPGFLTGIAVFHPREAMPTVISCPGCRKAFVFNDADAGTIMCPACGQSFQAPAGVEISHDEFEPAIAPDADAPTNAFQTHRIAGRPKRQHAWPLIAIAGAGACIVFALMIRAMFSVDSAPAPSHTPASGHALVSATAAPITPPDSAPPPSGFAPETENSQATGPAPATPDTEIADTSAGKAASQPPVAQAPPAPAVDMPEVPVFAPTAPSDPPSSVTEPHSVPNNDARSLGTHDDKSPAPPAILRPGLKPIPPPKDALTDEMVERSIRRGADYLLGRFVPKGYPGEFVLEGGGSFPGRWMELPEQPPTAPTDACGRDALAVYALLQAGLALHDPNLSGKGEPMKDFIDAIKRLPADTGHVTYVRTLRVLALSVFNRPEDRKVLQDDAQVLLKGERMGSYTYDRDWPAMASPGDDNSNSQFGLLGVWSAAEAGFEVPLQYWQRVDDHWSRDQFQDGQWSYRDINPNPGLHLPEAPDRPRSDGLPRSTMTAAGIVSTFIAHDYLDLAKFTGDVGRDPFTPALRRGLKWWEEGDNYQLQVNPNERASMGYVVFGIERVGLASGFKHFGSHEWYRELAIQLIARQRKNGGWEQDLDTSFILSFLARNRHPVMMNKLRFDTVSALNDNNHFWANRPHDAANLARWTSRELERPLNWQVVRLDHDWMDWADAPILSIASHQPLKFSKEESDKLRDFAYAGGMIFAQADGDSLPFDHWMKQFAHTLFPQYELQDVPPNHPLYTVNFRLGGRPKLKMISNGSRILLLYSPKDIARWWETRDVALHGDYFKFGANMFLYAGGKRDWRNKLQTTFVAEPGLKPIANFGVARLQYNGNWDPEPAAWPRLGRIFQFRTGYGIDAHSCTLAELAPNAAPLAHLTGTAGYDPTPREVAAIKKYVESGGVLLIDACGGSGPFAASMRKAIARAFPDSKFELVVPSHPLLNAGPPGMFDLTQRHVRLQVSSTLGNKYGGFEILAAGKGHVIFSALDLTSGLLGTDTWGIWGYTPEYCQQFVQNTILWAWDGQKDK